MGRLTIVSWMSAAPLKGHRWARLKGRVDEFVDVEQRHAGNIDLIVDGTGVEVSLMSTRGCAGDFDAVE